MCSWLEGIEQEKSVEKRSRTGKISLKGVGENKGRWRRVDPLDICAQDERDHGRDNAFSRSTVVPFAMSGEDTFKKFIEQLQQSGPGGFKGTPRAPRGSLGAAGVLFALIGGGLLLNASLFNGGCSLPLSGCFDFYFWNAQLMAVIVQLNTRGVLAHLFTR